jgi:PAS domain S-box-containing protein
MPPLKRKYKNFILFSSITVIVYGVYVLFYAWGIKKGIFNTAVTGPITMAIDTAACFILAGISLSCYMVYRSAIACILSRVLTAGVFIWCMMLLVRDLTIITIIKVPFVFGMSPQTAFCFVCLSCAFFFLNTKKRKYIIQGSLHLVTLIASIAIIGYFLNIPEFYEMTFIPMAIYTGIGFLLLSVAASFVNYDVGITGLFTGRLIGNLMARKLFLRMLVAILVIGFFRIFAHRQQWVSTELGSALLIIAFILISLALIWKTSNRLNRIDDKKRMARENFSVAFDLAPYALILSDSHGKISLVNGKTEKIYGYRRGELIGNMLETIIPEKLHNDHINKRDPFFAAPRVRSFGIDEELLAMRKDGSEFPIELLLTPVKTSNETFLLATVIDITQRKDQEDIIKKQLIELQFKNEELEQFNYISSHDLQEPLRTLSNYIRMLEEDYPENLNEEMKIHLSTMGSAIERMSCVVRSLLDFGKLGHKKKLVLTDCNELIQEVITDLDSLIKSSSAKVFVDCHMPAFYSYQTELRQLFQNLITNAIKFRLHDAKPEINIGTGKLKGFYEFYISDNGIGIDKKHSDKIFHIFHRINKDTDFEGHGLGLANCKKIVEMHGGHIWVESEPGKGSTFYFTILNFSP